MNGDLPSANYLLFPDDIETFRVRRSKKDVLEDIQWRGDFGSAADDGKNTVTAIGYLFTLRPVSDTRGADGEWVEAIFMNDEFVKFVRPPVPNAEDMEVIIDEGTPWSRPKPIKIDDISRIVRAVESEPVNFADLEMELKARPATPSQVDPGLTIAYLLLRAAGKTPKPESVANYKRNFELRDQFNAARLGIGMSETEVETVFKAKPLETVKIEAGTVKVYGSNESFDMDPVLRYSNVLVLFKEGKVGAIYAIEGGPDWRVSAQQQFADFPR